MKRFGPAFEVRDFRRWWIATFGMGTALQMLEVVIGYEVYAHQQSALDLGWIGLAEFAPLFVLALPAGHLADRVPRKLILAGANVLGIGVGVGLAIISAAGVTATVPYLAFAVGAGVTMALGQPAARSMPPTLVRRELLQSAMTLRSIAGQGAQVVGPALGGLIYGFSSSVVYLVAAGSCALAVGASLSIGSGQAAAETDESQLRQAVSLESVLEGLKFVRRTQIILGSILLDLLAVLFGGAVALLPIFTDHILHTGAFGLGVLRSGPAIGALGAAVFLTRRPIDRWAGRTLLTVVVLYGASIIVFGLSRDFALSFVALAVSGFVDLYSMNIRSTTVALATPDRLRGRVNAVEMVFISASNQLGAFESGLAASLVGAVPAVVGGGCMTIAIALSWIRLFPALGRVDRMQDITPEANSAVELLS
jgi:MFS family permease